MEDTKSYRILIPVSPTGHDPTEIAIPYQYFTANSRRQCTVVFATPDGSTPVADPKMLEGLCGALLGATAEAKQAYRQMTMESSSWKKPLSWKDNNFDILEYDCIFLPGGHDKGVRTIIEDSDIHKHLAAFFPLIDRNKDTKPSDNKKTIAAICHGVQVLAFTPAPTSPLRNFPIEQFNVQRLAEYNGQKFQSLIHGCKTTALPGFMESGIHNVTKAALGDYYKTFGSGTPTVEEYVTATLDSPEQFEAGPQWWQIARVMKPFVVEDQRMRYLSARFPGDAKVLAQRVIEAAGE